MIGRCEIDTRVSRALQEVTEAALQASKEYEGPLWGSGTGGGNYVCRDGKGRMTRKSPPFPSFQRWGSVGVLNISVMSSQVNLALGGSDSGGRLLCKETWTWLKDFFRNPELCLQVGERGNSFDRQKAGVA